MVALRTRTVPAAEAVAESLRALDLLLAAGATSTYFKFCSTFDSTDAGNIGPVADALAERLGSRLTLVCPAFPTNGRTVYLGHLFVGDRLLGESSMRDHPLTPMTDSDLVRVLGRQSRWPTGLLPLPTVLAGADAVLRRLESIGRRASVEPRRPAEESIGRRTLGITHLIADAVTDEHLDALGLAATREGLELCVGGSGLAGALARAVARAQGVARPAPVRVRGPSVVLAGSCSEATRGQVARFGGRRVVVDPRALVRDEHLDALRAALAEEVRAGRPVLLTSVTTPEEVAAVQRDLGRDATARRIEAAFAALARAAVEAGARRLIVAGGETAGAVVDALGLRRLRIGPTIAPGVPWTAGRPGDGRVGGPGDRRWRWRWRWR